MQFKTLSLLALSAVGAVANQDKRQVSATDDVGRSVLLVLATAIPPDSLSLAEASPSAFSAELASSISAGNPPAWYVALPSDVKSYLPKLYPASTPAVTTPAATAASSPAVTAPASISGSSPVGKNATAVVTVSSATLKSTGGANSQKPSTAPSSGGAAYPTAVVGAGVAGVLGFLGMLAL